MAAEAYPLVKTGGLGDVVGALPSALARLGADVRVMIPAYGGVVEAIGTTAAGSALGPLLPGFSARLLYSRELTSGVPLMLVDCPDLYQRKGGPYQNAGGTEWPDNHLRFGLLARAAALVSIAGELSGWRPDIVHVHDWHTGLVPVYLKAWGGPVPRTVLTVHNMAYQGLFAAGTLGPLALPRESFAPEGLEFWGQVSFLKAGLVYADRITMVSPTYAREVRQAPAGEGLEGVLATREKDIVGIVNGIDDTIWNPSIDNMIVQTFSPSTLTQKHENKIALCRELSLDLQKNEPVIGIVGRLVPQKGIDLVLKALSNIIALGAKVAILGTGDTSLEKALRAAAKELLGSVAVRCAYDETLAHRIMAGSDMLMMPSRYEPCGMTQLYAQRYGTLPIVRRVGGLADTVHDGEDGFTFDAATPEALVETFQRALKSYQQSQTWRKLQARCMAKDSSWDARAGEYLELYKSLINASVERQ